MGLQSLQLSKLYYTIGDRNTIAVNVSLGQDDILTLSNTENSIIPLQKTYSKSVAIETGDFPETAGIYDVKNKEVLLEHLSFNYNRKESKLIYNDLSDIENVNSDSSLANTINTIKSSSNVNALWKWFVIFALAFLIIEMLILKYLK